MDRQSKMCKDVYAQDREKLTQPNEAYTPRELIVRIQRNQRLPSLRCNFDPESNFPYSEKEDLDHPVLEHMEDEPEPPLDLTDLDIASKIVKDFNKDIEKARNSRSKKEEKQDKTKEKRNTCRKRNGKIL